jgi:hypothetical protein
MLAGSAVDIVLFIKRNTCYGAQLTLPGLCTSVLFNLSTTTSGSKRRGRIPSLIRHKELYQALATSTVFCFTLSGIRFPAPFLVSLFSQMQLSLWTRGINNPKLVLTAVSCDHMFSDLVNH